MKMQRVLSLLMLAACSCTGCHRPDDFREFNSYLDTGELRAEYGAPEVQLTIGSKLIWLGGLMAMDNRPASGTLLGVDQVQIVVYKLNRNPEPALNALRTITGTLQSRGWESVVSVSGGPERAHILVKTDADGISGVMIMAVDPGDEAVFINISGAISPDHIGDITRRWTPKWVYKHG